MQIYSHCRNNVVNIGDGELSVTLGDEDDFIISYEDWPWQKENLHRNIITSKRMACMFGCRGSMEQVLLTVQYYSRLYLYI